MKLQSVLMAGLMASIALAGCTDGGDGVDPDSGLGEGLGGITGLLVDDRFRPIHLTDNPTGEFQAEGTILVKPTGQLIEETTVNGEFELLGVAPGAYELVFQSDGYEAAPMGVEVTVGVVSEVTIEARRVANPGGTILTQEYAIFIDCWYTNPIYRHTEVNCFADLSRDSKRGGMRADYTHIEDVTYMVAEFLISDVGNYDTDIGFGEGELIEEVWARGEIRGGDYSRMLMTADLDAYDASVENGTDEYDGYIDNSRSWIAIVWPLGDDVPVYEPDMIPDEAPAKPGNWAGAGVSTRAQVVTTLFLGDPDLDPGVTLQDYCAICEE